MTGLENSQDRNTERRIRKHIYAQTQTIECLLPAGFTDLGKRVSEKMFRTTQVGLEGQPLSVKIHNGRIRLENVHFDLLHDILLDGDIFSEIGLRILRSRCANEQKLKQILAETEWDLWLPLMRLSNFQLRVVSQSSQLYHEGRIKKIIREFFETRVKGEKNNAFDESRTDTIDLDVVLERDVLEIFVCVSGRDFWKRGHKSNIRHAAPLREDIAACLVRRLAEASQEQLGLEVPRVIVNPFCGTGTLLHEAALFLWKCGRFPSNDTDLTYTKLPFFKQKSFEHSLKKRRASILSPDVPNKIRFIGEDLDETLCRIAQDWFDQSKINLNIQAQAKMNNVNSCLVSGENYDARAGEGVWILANPPFGVRLSARNQGGPEEIYSSFSKRIKSLFDEYVKKSVPACALVLCPNEKIWKTVKRILKEYHQECEHFTLGGLDIRAVYIFTRPNR